MVIATGHNTGGFAQAPVVAEAVGMTLLGSRHPMQWKYWPDRVQSK
jgi:D-amino-acid dehydrogenase